jgi:pimeloyl-ACP methyl ester carboxylesterase
MRLRGAARRTELSVRAEPDRGGPVAPFVSGGEALQDPGIATALLLVHGFNNTPTEARTSYGTFADHVLNALASSRVEPDAIVGFHWPGNAAVGPLSFMDVAGYPVDVHRAMEAAERLAEYLQNPGMRPLQLVIVGHSLGCRLVLEALKRLPQAPIRPDIGLVVLMAAAVPVNLAEQGQPLDVAQMPQERILKFHSTSDMVLWLAFPLGQSLANDGGGVLPVAIGRHGEPATLGHGLRTTNGHGQYWRDKGIANAVANFYDPTLPMPWRVYELPQAVEVAARELRQRNLPTRGLPI